MTIFGYSLGSSLYLPTPHDNVGNSKQTHFHPFPQNSTLLGVAGRLPVLLISQGSSQHF